MSIAAAKHGDATRARGSAALKRPGDTPAQHTKAAFYELPDPGPTRPQEDMPYDEHRRITAEWLITWLKEGDARLAMS